MNDKTKDDQDSGTFSFDSIEDAHENIQEGSSLPNEPAIEAHSDATIQKVKDAKGVKDSFGTVFDPALHAVNSEGEPSRTPLGKFRKRRGTSSVSTKNKALVAQQQTAEQKASARAAGTLAADMMIGSCVTLLGDEWIPVGTKEQKDAVKFDEHSNLRRSFADYFEARNISDFPPGIALSIAMTSYIMPRVVGGKETKSRLAKAKVWITEKYDNMRKKKDAAQPDSGNNRERKDDVSKETVQAVVPDATRHART